VFHVWWVLSGCIECIISVVDRCISLCGAKQIIFSELGFRRLLYTASLTDGKIREIVGRPTCRLHVSKVIHEYFRQSVVTDVRGVCLSVCPSVCPSVNLSVMRLNSASLCKSGWTDQDPVRGEHSWGPNKHCDRRESWSPHSKGEGDSMQPSPNYFGLLFYLLTKYDHVILRRIISILRRHQKCTAGTAY